METQFVPGPCYNKNERRGTHIIGLETPATVVFQTETLSESVKLDYEDSQNIYYDIKV